MNILSRNIFLLIIIFIATISYADDNVKFSGAIRMNYAYVDYNSPSKEHGDLNFDLFRINIDGTYDNILFSTDIRFYEYMIATRHTWIGYEFNKNNQIQIGLVPMPFGVMPYNSNNFFFSANYYLGLEDTFSTGFHWQYRSEKYDIDFGYYPFDALGGINGYAYKRNEAYTYNITGTGGLNSDNKPNIELAESNTFSFRVAYKAIQDNNINLELGISSIKGDIVNSSSSKVGSRYAYAIHSILDIGDINFKLQASRYKIDIDDDNNEIAVGAYAWNNLIASETTSYTANISYNLKVDLGPIDSLVIYNDYSLLTDKSSNLQETVMNVSGLSLGVGKFYTYIDFITAKNMPFIGGSMVGNTSEWCTRLNINVGYYF